MPSPRRRAPAARTARPQTGARKGRQLLAGRDRGWPAGPGVLATTRGLGPPDRGRSAVDAVASPQATFTSFPRVGGPRLALPGFPHRRRGVIVPSRMWLIPHRAAMRQMHQERDTPQTMRGIPHSWRRRRPGAFPGADSASRCAGTCLALLRPYERRADRRHGGPGGDGIVSAGELLLEAAAAEGYHGILTKSFGPQIRGGESSCRLRHLDRSRSLSAGGTLDVAVALNWDDFLQFGGELPVDGAHRRRLRQRQRRHSRPAPAGGRPPAEPVAVPIAELARAVRRAPTRPRTRSCSGCSPAGSASPRSRCWRRLRREAREEGSRGRRGRTSALSRPASSYAREHPLRVAAHAGPALPPGRGRSCSPTATRCAPRRPSSPAASSSAAIPITPSTEIMQFLGARDLEVRRHACSRRRTRSRASAPRSGASFAGHEGHDRDLGARACP